MTLPSDKKPMPERVDKTLDWLEKSRCAHNRQTSLSHVLEQPNNIGLDFDEHSLREFHSNGVASPMCLRKD